MPTKQQLLRQRTFALHGKRCYYCGKYATGKAMHIDHVAPRTGYQHRDNAAENLVPACRACNQRKGNKSFEDYVLWRLAQLKVERDLLVQRYRERFPDT